MTTATEPCQLLSGWCGQQGKPDCKGCTSTRCECSCHVANPAQPRALHDVSAVDFWEDGGTTKSSPRLQNPGVSAPGGDRGPNRTAKEFG